jgi:hypothetical protein
MLCSFRDLTFVQPQPDSIELFCIFDGKMGRPAGVILDELDRNLRRIAAFMNDFDGFSVIVSSVAWYAARRRGGVRIAPRG